MSENTVPPSDRAAIIERCVALAEARGVAAEDLDDMVHAAKGSEAAAVNNEGLEAQLEYLATGAFGDVEKYLSDLIDDLATDESRHEHDPRPDDGRTRD